MKKVKLAALGDLHIRESSDDYFKNLFGEIAKKADILVLCGDLTEHGIPSEAQKLASFLKDYPLSIVGVLGNHDFESDQQQEVENILVNEAKIHILDDEPIHIDSIAFTGTKGFSGGFESHMLGPFGEKVLKDFVYRAVDEAIKLENALSRAEAEKKVVVLHYSPIKQTCEGEPLEIYLFLGSSKLVDPIDYFKVNAVFHAHAHHGSLTGKTPQNVPVYNTSHPLLKRVKPEEPYVIVEI